MPYYWATSPWEYTSRSEWVIVFLVSIALVGFILAWRWECVGGIIGLIATLLTVPVGIVSSHWFFTRPGFSLLVGLSVLFLVSWLLRLKHEETAGLRELGILIPTCAFAAGAAIMFALVRYSEPSFREYAEARLRDVEINSANVFRAYSAEANPEVQAGYLVYTLRARDGGAVSASSYKRSLALAWTRQCITYQRLQREQTPRTCELAREAVNEWNPEWSYAKFAETISDQYFFVTQLPNPALEPPRERHVD